jgi:sterol desaturase/sphingolipid hydroxylase (fatty acid hydroxylase superfamily)
MELFALEHSRKAYWADFAAYGVAVVVLAIGLPAFAPRGQWWGLAICSLIGLAGWSLIEYGMHRFILHGMAPFDRWHALHHARPSALISAPTLLSATLIAGLVFLPALALAGAWRAGGLTLGVTIGYLLYAVTHHATHHWRAGSAWLTRRKRWHARHHHLATGAGCYGVSSSFWDRVFGTTGRGV